MVRDPAEAEDLTQETFLCAHCRQETLRDPEAARGWLYRIATHVCVDRLRQRRFQAARDSEEGAPQGGRQPWNIRQRSTAWERAEASACVQRCLDNLPDNHRAVILWYEGYGFTAAEIAELLAVSVGQ
jgi:RNA polymerase sigma-70 factor (ECF subfamily)